MNKLYVVGIGPGEYEQMTIKAANALKESDVNIGYTVYVDLVKEHFPGKEFMTTPMKKEVDRCVMAFEEAKKGKTVSMICSGDAGVYGMSGLMYEVGVSYPEVELSVIPGVTAATGGGAVLGAPLIHDFCLISLSDLLTPWEKIEGRLLGASKADFVICLYLSLIHILKELSKMHEEYIKVQDALSSVRGKGYGVVTPDRSEIVLEEPVVIKQGNKYGVKIKSSSPSIHMIKANIETEIAPIVGSEEQAKDLIAYIKAGEQRQESIWQTNIFGKSIEQLVEDGIHTKLVQISDESQVKLQDTMQKIVNDSKGGMVCIII